MAITEQTDLTITIEDSGVLLVRTASLVIRDEREVARTYHRTSHQPGDALPVDVAPRVRAVASAVWTPDVVLAYQRHQHRG